ncbi:hypothetical protein F2Q68_00033181 [Brassica cretica]|uniref:RNase H type-1 domain-containing protein n=1 Tax=Brassica cretica TaxID=69181 RepID=A0A8S9GC30_BRACR|nr:hypothetical protein F2Q68_00033181 [Brassica cretica]
MLSGPWHSVFTDVAWNSSTEEAGLGWIMDDEISASQYSATSTHVTSLLLAETLAVLAAMDFALSHGIDSIAVLSDSHILINTIKKKVMKLGIFGVLCDIYHLSTSFKIHFLLLCRIPWHVEGLGHIPRLTRLEWNIIKRWRTRRRFFGNVPKESSFADDVI